MTWHGHGQVDVELKVVLQAVVDLEGVIRGAIEELAQIVLRVRRDSRGLENLTRTRRKMAKLTIVVRTPPRLDCAVYVD